MFVLSYHRIHSVTGAMQNGMDRDDEMHFAPRCPSPLAATLNPCLEKWAEEWKVFLPSSLISDKGNSMRNSHFLGRTRTD